MALYDTNTLKALGGSAAFGTDGWQRGPLSVISDGSDRGKAFVEGFQKKNGHYPSDWSVLAYDCVMSWSQAAEAAKSVAADKLMDAIETADFESLRGAFKFGKYDHQADVPVFIGKVARSDKYKQPILDITETVAGASVRPSEGEVMKMRGK
jgi:branched-chain amino acid transport system substrate-binding protein